MLVTIILIVSLILQFLAVFLALRLIKITGKSLAWGLIAAAIALMALRRSISLVGIIMSGQAGQTDIYVELVALMISVLMAVGIWRITPIFNELKMMADRLRDSEARLRTLVQTIPDLVWLKDPKGVYLACNPMFERFFGAKEADIIGKTDYDFVDRELADSFRANDLAAVADAAPHINEEWLPFADDGHRALVQTTKTPMRAADGQLIGVLGIARDITELRNINVTLEQRVAKRTAQLETAIYDLENFNYSASHDLRIPLRAVDGFSRILLDEYAPKLDVEGLRLLNVVRDNARKMAQLIDDMQAFSRTGHEAMVAAEIDMNVLVREVADELKPTTAGREFKLEIKSLPPVFADRTMLRRVMINLLSNAIKFTRPKTAALIEVGARREDKETIYYVKDNGVGFDMQYVDKLFGVFQRLHGPAEFEGTGIGLAIVKRIITRHGGRVWAEGKLNEGATIYFALPTREAAHE